MASQITLLYAGLATLLLLVLSIHVIRLRWRYLVGLGDGGQPVLARAIRVHANFVEYTPIGLILLFLIERAGYASWVLHALGAALVVGRLAHAWGLARDDGPSIGRALGFTLTFGMLLAGALLALYSALGR
ncbi:MAG: MAPEG family protein [Alphaproteobacteria bacterium]|nr:MAPEG family protein [Alphaproteobacteria bacterium]